MKYYKNIEDMLTHHFENDGERDDNGELIKATGKPVSEKEWKDLKTNQLTEKIEAIIPQQSSEMIINYEELKNDIIQNSWYEGERKYAAQLLWALRKNNYSLINHFLLFGKDVFHAIRNINHYDALKKFGFVSIKFDEHGWLKKPDWQYKETIQFGDNNNSITVGMGRNGKWAYGLDCENSTSGHFCGINEWMKPFTSKEAAIKEGIEIIKQFHTKALTDQSLTQKSKTIANKVLQKIKEYNNPIQGSIFDDVTKPSNTTNTTQNKEMEQELSDNINRENYIPGIDIYDINKINPERKKIGQGYWQNGYGKGFISSPIIWEINGFAYARHKKGYDLLFDNKDVPENFVPVNYSKTFKEFHALGADEKHQKYPLKQHNMTQEEKSLKLPVLKVGQNYETDSKLGGTFTVKYLGVDKNNKHLFENQHPYDDWFGKQYKVKTEDLNTFIIAQSKSNTIKKNVENTFSDDAIENGRSIFTPEEIEKLHAEHLITDAEKEKMLNEKSNSYTVIEGLIIKKHDFEKMHDYFIQKRNEGEEFIAFNSDPFPVEKAELFTFNTLEEAEQFCRDNVSDMDSYNYLPTRSIYRAMAEAKLDDTLMIENGSGAIDISQMVAARYNRLETQQSLNQQFQTNKNNNTMEQKNLDYLANQIKYLGFGEDQKGNLQKQMEKGEQKFNLTVKQQYDGYPIDYTLHFNKSNESDRYFLNSYNAVMANGRHQTIYLDKGKGFTAKETFNLMQDRAVFKELRNKNDGSTFDAWIKLSDPQDGKKVNDSRKIHIYNENYGYNLEQTLAKHPIKELKDEGDKKKLIASLQKGNRQAVTFSMPDGTEERKFIEARPKGRGLNIYNKNGKPMKKEETAKQANRNPIQKVTPDEKKAAGIKR